MLPSTWDCKRFLGPDPVFKSYYQEPLTSCSKPAFHFKKLCLDKQMEGQKSLLPTQQQNDDIDDKKQDDGDL